LAPSTQKPKTPKQGFLHPQRFPMPPVFAIKVVQRELLVADDDDLKSRSASGIQL
jgi:hypothetical protein